MQILRRDAVRMSGEKLEQTLETLSAFLRSEAFAAHTYQLAMDRVSDPGLRSALLRLRNSHAGRAFLLRERIAEFGGRPDDGTDPWGAFADAVHKVLRAADDRALLLALGDGERWGVRDYEMDLGEIEPAVRRQLEAIVLGEQRRTSQLVHDLLTAWHPAPGPSPPSEAPAGEPEKK